MKDIKKIVLTGGPCAGKTTALVKIIDHFSSMGFKVFTIPEVPTLFAQSGMDYLTKNRNFFYEGEKATLEIQLALEDKFIKMAEQVDGAEEFYTTSNNKERTEGLVLARELDKKVINAWTEHPHLRVINNHQDFNTKINRVLKEISAVLGLPQPITEERKYIVKVTGEIPSSIDSHITQTYLVSDPDSEVRLRQREWANGNVVNVHTTTKTLNANQQVETERQVSNALYESLLSQADPYRQTICKQRKSFIWKGQYFELDAYEKQLEGLVILETKGITDKEHVNFPPFIEEVEDITGNRKYYNYNLALRH